MNLFLSLLLLSLTFSMSAQNVGINKLNPTEKLDVNGNINISGTIKANGTAGTSGQILMSTGAGLSWGSAMGYKKCMQFYSAGTFSWTVPVGVTEVMVELWGAVAEERVLLAVQAADMAELFRPLYRAPLLDLLLATVGGWTIFI